MAGAATKAGAEALAKTTAAVLQQLPEGITGTVILCAGDEEHFEVSIGGSTPPALLRLVLLEALARLEKRLAQ